MKATIVLIADTEAENYGRKMMLEAHRFGNTGFEMARLPQHVSLKQPFFIPSLEKMEMLFDTFAKSMHPVNIEITGIDLFRSNVLNGVESGCISLRVESTPQLVDSQRQLNEELYHQFGPCPAEHDNDYIFHMTVAIGGADFNSYQKAYAEMKQHFTCRSFRFDKLGLFYYDDDNIAPGTYFCYKVCEIK